MNHAAVLSICATVLHLTLVAAEAPDLRSGVFAGPVIGLKYRTPTSSGTTNELGEFRYRAGEAITFSVGDVILGTTRGSDRVTLAHLLSRVNGHLDKVRDPELTNMARLLQTLDQDRNPENGVTITSQTHAIVGNRRIDFSHIPRAGSEGGEERLRGFAQDPVVVALLAELNPPRQLRSPAAARNELRRNIRGILKTTDVKIPLRDGSYLYADVFQPARAGKFPPILDLSVYGKAFERGCICDQSDAEKREEMEDRYFSGNPDAFQYENHEAINSTEWVPLGYVAVRIDSRGACRSPGRQAVFSFQEAKDYYDAVEWAARQSWSNGNVGLWGMSYTAVNQQNVASLQPPSLKAMVSIATDVRFYEERLYSGGISSDEWWGSWWYRSANAVCGPRNSADFVTTAKNNPFQEPALYGPTGSLFMSPDVSRIVVPQWVVMPQTHRAHIHQLGSSEAFIHANTKQKKLDVVEDWFATAYNSRPEHVAFFDHWLKGIANAVMETPPVRLQVRTGDGNFVVKLENEWPIARTRYEKWYLDATPSSWVGDGRRSDFLSLSKRPPSSARQSTYSAEVDIGALYPRELAGTPCWATGVTFITDPVDEDTLLAGYMKLGLWVSSTSSDMDIYASVRALDSQNREVDFSGPIPSREGIMPRASSPYPLGIGWLKASHRKLDPSRSTVYAPKHTHRQVDYSPLQPEQVTPVEVEIWPSTALVRKGSRIRLDIQPYDGCGHGQRHGYDETYHTGARNTIYTGPEHSSYLQLPVVSGAAGPAQR